MTSPQQEQLSELCLKFQYAATALGNAFKPLAEQLPYIVKALKALQGMTEELDPQEPEWWPLHISADGGGFGRFRWFNGSDEFWGECWWDGDLP